MKILLKFIILGFLSSLLFPPFFILPIGLIIFPFLFFLLIDKEFQNKNKLFHFISGLSYGISMNFVVLIWIKEPFLLVQTTRNYYFISYLLILYCSIYYGLSFFILSFIKNNFSKLILIPILFVVSEILREESIDLKRINLKGLKTGKGITEWNGQRYDNEVEKCMRIWPHQNDTDGFFVARMEKC